MTDYERNEPTKERLEDQRAPVEYREAGVEIRECPHQFPWWRVVTLQILIAFFVAVAVVVLAR